MYVLRDQIRVKCEATSKVDFRQYYNPDNFVLRFFYKHKEGSLWCFNRPYIEKQYFKEVPDPLTGLGVKMNKFEDTQERRFQEEDEENDVDLEKAMWLIVRKKRSIN